MGRDKKIKNAIKRGEVYHKSRRDKEQEKLKRRLEVSCDGLASANSRRLRRRRRRPEARSSSV